MLFDWLEREIRSFLWNLRENGTTTDGRLSVMTRNMVGWALKSSDTMLYYPEKRLPTFSPRSPRKPSSNLTCSAVGGIGVFEQGDGLGTGGWQLFQCLWLKQELS